VICPRRHRARRSPPPAAAHITRRRLLTGAGALGALGLITTCGGAADTTTAPSAPGTAGYPITVEHRNGTTRIPAPPQRVVTVGYSDQDPVLALGVRPVGVTDWYGDHPFATWPWAIPPEIGQLAGDQDGATISDEQMGLLDRDVLLWNTGYTPEVRPEIEAAPLYSQMAVVRAGRSLFVEDPLVSAAWTCGTVLSLPSVIDALVAQLDAVVT
jgi:ABC-type Fe3+-hydroxamate transport system substrate-binding protein